MKIISWNVAGLRACFKKGFSDFFMKENADIYCLQETKVTEDEIPYRPLGYDIYLYPAKKKGYSGVMIYSRVKPISVRYGIGESEYDDEGRCITLEFSDFYLVTCYVPNVKRDLSRLSSRMRFEDLFRDYLNGLKKVKNVIVCGDLNVAHSEMDIKNAKANRGHAGFTDEERGKFDELLSSGFIDTFRFFNPFEEKYTWWSYIGKAREKNVGWRIDYFLVNSEFINRVKKTYIFGDVYGSDHCPIGLDIND